MSQNNQHTARLTVAYILRCQERDTARATYQRQGRPAILELARKQGILQEDEANTSTKHELIELIVNHAHPLEAIQRQLAAKGVDLAEYEHTYLIKKGHVAPTPESEER